MSLAFAEAGAELMLADINETGAQQTAREIETLGRRAVPVRCDLSEPNQIRALFEAPTSRGGALNPRMIQMRHSPTSMYWKNTLR